MSFKVSVIVPAYNMEAYIRETLDSLVAQSLEELEVIMVNDGSIDGTPGIMEEYQDHHPHFKLISQGNKGTSTAKNRGINEAQGTYLAFLDGDDKFTPLALEKMYLCAHKKGAELVVGRSQIFSCFGKSYLKDTVELARKEIIEPFDPTLVWSFSQSNKLFLGEKVQEMGLQFPDKKYAEDGIFVLDFAHHSNRIVGCPEDVLLYRRRVLGYDYSATQTITRTMMEEYLKAYQEILHLSRRNFQERYGELDSRGQDYLEEIRYKECKLFLDQFYRHFWRIPNQDLEFFKEKFLDLKKELSPVSRQRLSQECPDLPIKDLVDDKDVMAKNPFLSLAIHPHCTPEELELLLDSVYAQDNPYFEVLNFETWQSRHQDRHNFRTIKEEGDWKDQAQKDARGQYLWFLDDLLVLGPSAIRNFIQYTSNCEMDMVAAPLSQLSEGGYPSQELVFLYRNTQKPEHQSLFNVLDLYLSNKILGKDYLQRFKFSGNTSRDVHRLYQETKFRKVHHKNLYSFKEEKELLKTLKTGDPTLSVQISLALLITRILYQGIRLKRKLKKQ